nr:methyltransferase domain-containing protein [Planosporangium thailandense]
MARHPLTVGAIAPSSEFLATRIVAPVPLRGDPVVVELGPGTGVFTDRIQQRLAGRGRHIAIEVNRRFADRLVRRRPAVDVVIGDAAAIGGVLADRGCRTADVVVSGLPWALFPPARQQRTLDAIAAALAPAGVFSTFAYVHALWTPTARRLRRALCARFEEVVMERTVWANLPPATVYHCRRPVHSPGAA